MNRVEATENRQRDTVSEFRTALGDTTSRLAAVETRGPCRLPRRLRAEPIFSPLPQAFDAPPFPDVPTPGAPPPFQAQTDPFAHGSTFDAPPFAEDPFAPAGESFTAMPPPAGDSFLSAARRSARPPPAPPKPSTRRAASPGAPRKKRRAKAQAARAPC